MTYQRKTKQAPWVLMKHGKMPNGHGHQKQVIDTHANRQWSRFVESKLRSLKRSMKKLELFDKLVSEERFKDKDTGIYFVRRVWKIANSKELRTVIEADQCGEITKGSLCDRVLNKIAGRHDNPKRAKPIKSSTKKRAKQLREYRALAADYLVRFPWCAACFNVGLAEMGLEAIPKTMFPELADKLAQKQSSEIHHTHGRIGGLLLYEPWWIPTCRSCHQWIDANRAKARKLKLLCEEGQWNVQPKGIV